jgi:tripartite-type tricarboxylate transporter receptor subunit TctC
MTRPPVMESPRKKSSPSGRRTGRSEAQKKSGIASGYRHLSPSRAVRAASQMVSAWTTTPVLALLLVLLSALLVALVAAPVTARAQAWPTGPITMIVPFAAGSGTDGVARALAQRLGERLGQPVLVENKPGASAQIAALAVARAKPDGYTLFMTTNTSHSANPSLFKSLRYDPIRDFTPITRVGELPFALAVSPELPVRTLKEFIAYARSHPGEIAYATPNSTSLVSSETIRLIEDLKLQAVPYKSSPQAMADLMGGQVQMYVADLASGLSALRSDRVRALGVTTARPSPLLPGVPPIAQTVAGFDLTSWNGIFGPAALPRTIVERLNQEILAVLSQRDLQDGLAQMGFQVWPSKTPEEFARYVQEQLLHWAELTRRAGIEPQ